MAKLSFIINKTVELPDPKKVIAAAAEMGIRLSVSDKDAADKGAESSPEIQSFDLDDEAVMMVCLMPVPHPDVAEMAQGPLSPDDLDELIEAPAHFVVTAMGNEVLDADGDASDILMSGLTAAVLAGCDAVGVLQMPGILFHRPELFANTAQAAMSENEVPVLICVDLTAARESETRMSLLTHNMQRYGREEFYVTASIEAEGAVPFTFDMMMWMLNDRQHQLPTGDTVGRTPDEKIKVQRVPNPIGEGPEVILLELP